MLSSILQKLLLFVVLFHVACNDAGTFSDASKDDPKKEDSEKNSGDKTADEPVMVGGAYLACANIGGSGGSVEIGCALNSQTTGAKHDLSGYDLRWDITEGGSPIDVRYVDGSQTDPFHRKFIYANASHQKHSLHLGFEDKTTGTSYSYGKVLSQLDQDLRSKSSSVNLFQLDQSGEFSGTIKDSSGDLSACRRDLFSFECQLALIQQAMTASTNKDPVCRNGQPNEAVIKSRFHIKGFSKLARRLDFRQVDVEKCVAIRGNTNSIYESGGCYVVPMIWRGVELKYQLIDAAKSGKTLAEVRRLGLQFACK